MSQYKNIKRFLGGLNRDDDPSKLPPDDFTDGFNIRTATSSDQKREGPAETLQGEVEVLIDVSAEIEYYGQAIGGEFLYSGYSEVQIGTQTWLKRNWDFDYPGSKIYGDDEANLPVYGRLYTWHQAMASDFCPQGWHMPTEAEIDTLLTYLGGAMIAGGKMKEPGISHWNAPNIGADNSSGFKALAGGKYDAAFSLLQQQGLFWIVGEGIPLAPVALPATNITALTFMANWAASDGADGYYLDVSIDPAFTSFVAGFNNKDEGNTLNDNISGLIPGIDYYYRVRAYNEIGTSANSNVITLTTSAVAFPLIDRDANIYTTVIIGAQEWIIENYRVTQYADGILIPNIPVSEYTDWYLPSKDELQEIYNELYLFGVGGLTNNWHWCSSESDATNAQYLAFSTGAWGVQGKHSDVMFRPIRSFAGAPGDYALRDSGPAGGLIFAYAGGNYYECGLVDMPITAHYGWSNVDLLVGVGTAIGTGAANTAAIIAQAGHTGSAALLCDNYSAGGWVNDLTGAYCWYDNDIANKTSYGALYNRYAANNAHEIAYLERNGVQEPGWKVPEYNDFVTLANFIGGFGITAGKLKEIGFTHWDTPNTGASDSYGFKALGAGNRLGTGIFDNLKTGSVLWTDADFDANSGYGLALTSASAMSLILIFLKKQGCSIRLVRSTGLYLYDDTLLEDDTYLE